MAANKFMLLFNGCNKIVTFDKDVVKAEDLIRKSKEIFPNLSLSAFCLQKYAAEFEEHAEIESDEEVPPKSKIRVQLVDREKQPSGEGTSGFGNPGRSSAFAASVGESDEPSTSENARNDAIGRAASTGTRDTNGAEQGPVQSQTSVSKKCSGWYITYKLPTFTAELNTKMESGEEISAGDESSITDILFESIKQFSPYPKPKEYAGVIEKLLSKYPRISGLDATNQHNLWVNKLKYKFQNRRSRDGDLRNLLEVKQRKRKQPPKKYQTQKQKAKQIKFPPMFGVSNYLPDLDAAEDTETTKKQIQWMQIECTKKRPDYKGVGDRMNNTFANRHQQIVGKGFASTQLIKAEYPWLFRPEPDEFLAEFKRIHGSDFTTLVEKGLRRLSGPILKTYQTRCKRSKSIPCMQDADEETEKDSDEETDKEDLEETKLMKQAINVLPFLLGEDIGNIVISDKDDARPAVYILKATTGATTYDLIIDGEEVCSMEDIITGISCYLASFYVFHLSYDSRVTKTLEFYQLAILGIKDNCPVDKSVVSLINRLSKLSRC